MRKTLTLLNGLSGLINRMISIIFLFFVRHYFTKYLDVEYLGFEGLFANILGLFSLIDLGLGNAISFNLYEPLHRKDRTLVSSIMEVYKKLYMAVGIIIFILAMCAAPAVPFFIKDSSLPSNTIRFYFLIYALSVSVTYFFSYKRTLIFALQKNYIVMNVDSITKMVLSAAQILLLVRFQNYTSYLAAAIIINFSGNVVISFFLNREDTYDTKNVQPLTEAFKNRLKAHVKALAVTNISWQGISSTDNIIISSMIGVIDLARNANYSTIAVSINSIVATILGGVSASIGDLIAEGNPIKIKAYFDRYCFIYCIVSSYAALGVYFVSEPLISVWVGEHLVLGSFPVFLIAVNLFLTLIFRPLAEYQNFSGNFVYYKPYSIAALLINIVASIILAFYIGISGVFLGTTITYCFMISSVVSILYKRIFASNPGEYYRKMLINFSPAPASFALLCLLKNHLSGNFIFQIFVMSVIVTIVYFLMVILILRKTQDFCFFEQLIERIIHKILGLCCGTRKSNE